MTARTFNGGFVQMGNALSITNGVTAEVRALILEREGRDKARRAAYPRRSNTTKPGRKGDTFRTYIPTH